MTPDQQRSIEEKIIEGNLIEAIGLYRTATGCSLAEAENAVRLRSSELSGAPQPSTAASFAPQTDVAQAEAAVLRAVVPRFGPMLIFGVLVALIPLAIGGIALFGVAKSLGGLIGHPGGSTLGTLSTLVTAPGKLGGNMLRRESYYPTVVKDIKNDKNFRAALGSPIAIDEDGISCRTIKNGYTSNTANCTLPVRGAKASGDVTVVVVDQPGSFGVAGKLVTAGRTIVMGQP